MALLLSLFLALPLGSGCVAVYMDQARVEGTNQRIAVGHDSWPFKKAWVLENGTISTVRIVGGD